jgi:hypothetical protein
MSLDPGLEILLCPTCKAEKIASDRGTLSLVRHAPPRGRLMAWSRAHADASRREQARRAHTAAVFVDVVLECGHETLEPPVVRFADGRERFRLPPSAAAFFAARRAIDDAFAASAVCYVRPGRAHFIV